MISDFGFRILDLSILPTKTLLGSGDLKIRNSKLEIRNRLP